MNIPIYPILEKEKKLREHWFIALIAVYAVRYLRILICYHPFGESSAPVIMGTIFGILFGCAFAKVNYHFVYKKFGTKFVGFFLIWDAVSFPFMAPTFANDSFEMVFECVDLLLYLWLWMLSVQMFLLNRKVKLHRA